MPSELGILQDWRDSYWQSQVTKLTSNLQVPGNLPDPYYWWEAGAMFGSLIDYWYYTGDDTYNKITMQAMLHQVGPDQDYQPPNQTKSLGNDDQAFWGLAAMSAAEQKFPNPPADTDISWLALAQAVFNTQDAEWDNETCGGGLRWQKVSFNVGYDYKNTITNGAFFNLAARLGYYTHNESYLEAATRSWDWCESVGLIGGDYKFPDGTWVDDDCHRKNTLTFSYNAGVFLLGASVMFNQTEGDTRAKWRQRIEGIISGAGAFFDNNVMVEIACEATQNCNTDQLSFKAYLSRWMAASTKMAPFIEPEISNLLQTSAKAAAASCSGGEDGVTCGTRWNIGSYDGTYGVGQQMSALEVVQGLLIDDVAGPVSNTTGGTSKGDPTAGTGPKHGPGAAPEPITTSDRAGAGILTALVLSGIVGGTA